MEDDETTCPKCRQQYSEANPPRLLIMCGHTLCDSCIADLIPRKKIAHKYRLICPFDKISGELSTPAASAFPKNIAILNLVKKKNQTDLSKHRVSNIPCVQATDSSFLSIDFLENLQQNKSLPTSNEAISFLMDEMQAETCLLHQKPLQIICTRDCKRICANCVIFGEHRGHKVKKVSEVEELEQQLKQRLTSALKREEQIFDQLKGKDMIESIDKALQKKKGEFERAIRKKYKELVEQIVLGEKKATARVDKKIQELKNKIHKSLQEKLESREKYSDWQQKIGDKLSALRGSNEEEKLAVIFRSAGFVENCCNILDSLAKMRKQFDDETEQMIGGLTLVFEDQEILSVLKGFCKVDEGHNSFLEMTSSRINREAVPMEESLLDDLSIQPTLITSGVNFKGFQESVVSQESSKTQCKLNRVKSTHRERVFCSPAIKPLKSSKILNLGSNKNLTFKGFKSKGALPQKYEKCVANVMGGSDLLDLANGELGDDKVLETLVRLKGYPIRILKLVRNKITDDGLEKLQPFVQELEMLNLSRNNLTDRSFERLLEWRRSGKMTSLKSLILGQNKILERKHRAVIQELKSTGLNVCL